MYHINRSLYKNIELYVTRISTFETTCNSDHPIPLPPTTRTSAHIQAFPHKISGSRGKEKKRHDDHDAREITAV